MNTLDQSLRKVYGLQEGGAANPKIEIGWSKRINGSSSDAKGNGNYMRPRTGSIMTQEINTAKCHHKT